MSILHAPFVNDHSAQFNESPTDKTLPLEACPLCLFEEESNFSTKGGEQAEDIQPKIANKSQKQDETPSSQKRSAGVTFQETNEPITRKKPTVPEFSHDPGDDLSTSIKLELHIAAHLQYLMALSLRFIATLGYDHDGDGYDLNEKSLSNASATASILSTMEDLLCQEDSDGESNTSDVVLSASDLNFHEETRLQNEEEDPALQMFPSPKGESWKHVQTWREVPVDSDSEMQDAVPLDPDLAGLESTDVNGSSIEYALRQAMEPDLTDKSKRFLPLTKLGEICDQRNVTLTIQMYFSERIAELVHFVGEPPSSKVPSIPRSAQKIFAILALSGCLGKLQQFAEDGVHDTDLPLLRRPDDNTAVYVARQRDDGSIIHTTPNCFIDSGPLFIDSFERIQWEVLVPYFHKPVTVASLDHKFHPKTIMPWTLYEESSPRQRDFRIFKVKICKGHHAFDYDSFTLQTTSSEAALNCRLFLHQSISSIHLIDPCTTFKHGHEYSLLFPWASGGSLNELWSANPSRLVTRNYSATNLILWIFEQCAGLSDLLAEIHSLDPNQHVESEPSTPDSDSDAQDEPHSFHRNARAARESSTEFKQYVSSLAFPSSQNILHFTDDWGKYGLGILKIGGQSQTMCDPRNKNEQSPDYTNLSYTAPENRHQRDFSTLDIWALGCLFSELVTWAIRGPSTLSQFRSHCQHEWNRGADASLMKDFFFFNINTEMSSSYGLRRISVKSTVLDCMGQNKNVVIEDRYHSIFLLKFIDFITDRMLVVDPESRADITELRRFFSQARSISENSLYWSSKLPTFEEGPLGCIPRN